MLLIFIFFEAAQESEYLFLSNFNDRKYDKEMFAQFISVHGILFISSVIDEVFPTEMDTGCTASSEDIEAYFSGDWRGDSPNK